MYSEALMIYTTLVFDMYDVWLCPWPSSPYNVLQSLIVDFTVNLIL